jgi:hypothetical protein
MLRKIFGLKENCVGFEVLTSVVMKSSVSWDTTRCSLLKFNQILKEHVASVFRVEK